MKNCKFSEVSPAAGNFLLFGALFAFLVLKSLSGALYYTSFSKSPIFLGPKRHQGLSSKAHKITLSPLFRSISGLIVIWGGNHVICKLVHRFLGSLQNLQNLQKFTKIYKNLQKFTKRSSKNLKCIRVL